MGDWGSEWFGWLIGSIHPSSGFSLNSFLSEFLGFFLRAFSSSLIILFFSVVLWNDSRRRFLACSPFLPLGSCNIFTLFPHLIRFPF
jgi:hypothetical protein